MISEEALISILGKDLYDGCINFFVDILTYPSEYKIILARRCFSLYKIFKPILMKKDYIQTKDIKGKIITDNAMPLYKQELTIALCNTNRKHKSVLVVDDIIIFGRTINSILADLLSELGPDYIQNVSVPCITKSKDTCKIKKEYQGCIAARFPSDSVGWKICSSDFSKAIKAADIANTSYIVSYKNSDENCFNYFKNICGRFMETTTAELESINVQSFVIGSFGVKNILGSDVEPCSFVRIYLYNDLKSVVVSPLVIINDLADNQISDIITNLSVPLDDTKNTKKLLETRAADLCTVCARFVSLMISHLLLCHFLKKYDISADIANFDYEEIISHNFSEEITAEFKNVLHGALEQAATRYFENIIYSLDELDMNSIQELEDFIFTKAMQDNNAANNDSSQRQKGTAVIDTEPGNKPIFCARFIPALMQILDNGIAALKMDQLSQNSNICSSLICPGEQAFRIITNKFSYVLPALRTLRNVAYVYDLKEHDLFEEFAEKMQKNSILGQSEYESLSKYIEIMKNNKQSIKSVFYIGKEDVSDDRSDVINDCLDDFLSEKSAAL